MLSRVQKYILATNVTRMTTAAAGIMRQLDGFFLLKFPAPKTDPQIDLGTCKKKKLRGESSASCEDTRRRENGRNPHLPLTLHLSLWTGSRGAYSISPAAAQVLA